MNWTDLDQLRAVRMDSGAPFFEASEVFWIMNTQKERPFFLVDIRRKDEILETGFLPDSLPIVWGGVDFMAALSVAVPVRDSNVIIYCRSGRRSAAAVELARINDYVNASNLKGGILSILEKFPSWVERGSVDE